MPIGILPSSVRWGAYPNGRHGPFYNGTDAYVVVCDTVTASPKVRVYRSTDGGASWIEQHAAGAPTITGDNAATGINFVFNANRDGTNIVITTLAGGQLACRLFSMSTNTYGTATNNLATTTAQTSFAVQQRIPTVRRSDGSVIVPLQGGTTSVSGKAYRRAFYARHATGSTAVAWTAPAGIQATSTAHHYDIAAIALGATNRTHIFYTRRNLDGTTNELMHRTLTSANALQTEQVIDGTISPNVYAVGRPWFDGTTITVPYIDADGALKVATATSADVPAWTASVAVSDTGNEPEGVNSNPGAITHDGTDWHALWPNDAQTSIIRDKTTGGAWGTDATLASSIGPVNGINVGPRSATVIGVLYDDNGTVTYDEFSTVAAPPSDPKSAPDSQAIASSDTSAVAAASTRVDSQAITSSDTATNAAASTVNDAQVLGSSDTAAITATTAKAASDAQSLGSSDAASRIETAAKAASDSQALASLDTATSANANTVADTQGVSSSEAATTATTAPAAETQTLGSTDTATAATTATVADTHALSSSDTASISEQSTKAATDSQVIASSDTATVLDQAAKAAADSQALASTDTASAVSDGLATDATVITGTDGVTLQVAGVASDSQAVGSSESVSVVVTMVVGDGQILTSTDTATAAEVLEVYYPWPATVTFTAIGGPAVSLTAITSPSGQPDAIPDAPAVSLSAISGLTVTLAGVSDGPATVLGSITGSTATFANIAPPDGAWTAIADPVDLSGVVPGPDATISIVALPGSTFTAVPVPSGAGSLILEPTARVAAISDGPAITPVVYTMPEG